MYGESYRNINNESTTKIKAAKQPNHDTQNQRMQNQKKTERREDNVHEWTTMTSICMALGVEINQGILQFVI